MKKIHVEPYHTYGKNKSQALGSGHREQAGPGAIIQVPTCLFFAKNKGDFQDKGRNIREHFCKLTQTNGF